MKRNERRRTEVEHEADADGEPETDGPRLTWRVGDGLTIETRQPNALLTIDLGIDDAAERFAFYVRGMSMLTPPAVELDQGDELDQGGGRVEAGSIPIDDLFELALQFAHRPENVVELIDRRNDATPADELQSLAIEGARAHGRKPDEFYAAVLERVEVCRRLMRPYAPYIAAANGVQDGTVHRWVHEARRRGLDPDHSPTDAEGVIRLDDARGTDDDERSSE